MKTTGLCLILSLVASLAAHRAHAQADRLLLPNNKILVCHVLRERGQVVYYTTDTSQYGPQEGLPISLIEGIFIRNAALIDKLKVQNMRLGRIIFPMPASISAASPNPVTRADTIAEVELLRSIKNRSGSSVQLAVAETNALRQSQLLLQAASANYGPSSSAEFGEAAAQQALRLDKVYKAGQRMHRSIGWYYLGPIAGAVVGTIGYLVKSPGLQLAGSGLVFCGTIGFTISTYRAGTALMQVSGVR